MSKVLIVCNNLKIGGGEKLVYEIASFALRNNLTPVVFVPDAYNHEYYDSILKEMNIQVVRANIRNWSKLRNPVKLLNSLYWKFRLKYFSKQLFASVQIVNLVMAERYFNDIPHPKRFFWDVVNAAQYNGKYNYSQGLFSNGADSLVFINRYQELELDRQYPGIKLPRIHFKLFLDDPA